MNSNWNHLIGFLLLFSYVGVLSFTPWLVELDWQEQVPIYVWACTNGAFGTVLFFGGCGVRDDVNKR